MSLLRFALILLLAGGLVGGCMDWSYHPARYNEKTIWCRRDGTLSDSARFRCVDTISPEELGFSK